MTAAATAGDDPYQPVRVVDGLNQGGLGFGRVGFVLVQLRFSLADDLARSGRPKDIVPLARAAHAEIRNRRTNSAATAAAASATSEPIKIVQRALYSPTQPMIGDPSGVPPMKTAI